MLHTITITLALSILSAEGEVEPSKRIAVVAVGSCDATGAASLVQGLREALAARSADPVQSERETAEALGGAAEKSLSDVERMIASAWDDFFRDIAERAAQTLRKAREHLLQVPPSPARWVAERNAGTLLALVHFKADRRAEAEQALTSILAVEPDYRPDPALYSPRFRGFVDAVRAKVRWRMAARLEVTTRPSGVPVYVGGRNVGRSPVTVAVLPGEYRVEADFNGRRGLVRSVRLGAELGQPPNASIELSRAFEGAVSADGGPCVQASERKERLDALVRLASLVGAQLVVGVRLQELSRGERYVIVTAIDAAAGEETREAKLRLASTLPTAAELEHLASFMVTGEVVPPVEATVGALTPVAVDSPVAIRDPPLLAHLTPSPIGPLANALRVEAGARIDPSRRRARVASYATAGVGVLALGSAGFFHLRASNAEAALGALGPDGHFPAGTEATFERSNAALAWNRGASLALAGVGAASVVAAAVLFALSREQAADF